MPFEFSVFFGGLSCSSEWNADSNRRIVIHSQNNHQDGSDMLSALGGVKGSGTHLMPLVRNSTKENMLYHKTRFLSGRARSVNMQRKMLGRSIEKTQQDLC